MRIPESLIPLVDHGVVDEVVRSLKSGKEADVYLVASEGFYRVAKVYKDAQSRSFKNRAAYTEGRQVRSSRDQRAMDKGSKYGKAQNEAAWQSAEVDMIYRLDAAGVRVPKPHHFIDGVLIMELVASAEGEPAPRLGELEFTGEEAQAIFTKLLADVVKMLCAGVVHGDLSEFNVLVAAEGPVVIDFPQSVNASKNQNARKMLMRDVQNLQDFLKRYVPTAPPMHYAEEMWALYEKGELTPETQLTGKFVDERKQANTGALLGLIDDARRDERFKRQQSGRNFRGLGSATPPPEGASPHAAPHGRAHPNPRPQHAPHPNGARPQSGHAPRPHASGPRQQNHPRPPQGQAQHAPRQQSHAASQPPRHGAQQRPAPGANPQRQPHAQPQRPPHAQPQRPPNAQPQRPPNPARTPQDTNPPRGPQGPHAARPQPGHNPRPFHPQNGQRPAQPARPAQPRARATPIVETRPQLAGLAPGRPSAPRESTSAPPAPPQRK